MKSNTRAQQQATRNERWSDGMQYNTTAQKKGVEEFIMVEARWRSLVGSCGQHRRRSTTICVCSGQVIEIFLCIYF